MWASWHFTSVSPTHRRTLVGQEHAPSETSRPLSTGPDPCGRWPSFAAARPLLRFSLGFGPTMLGHTYIPQLQSEGALVLGQYFRIVVIMRLRIFATIAIDPLFEIIRTVMAINSCTSPRSHIGTSSVPSPTTMGADPASAFSFGVESPCTSLKRVLLSPSPLCFHTNNTNTAAHQVPAGMLGATKELSEAAA